MDVAAAEGPLKVLKKAYSFREISKILNFKRLSIYMKKVKFAQLWQLKKIFMDKINSHYPVLIIRRYPL